MLVAIVVIGIRDELVSIGTEAAWTAWFGRLGESLVDGGNPASKTKTIKADGSVSDEPSVPSG